MEYEKQLIAQHVSRELTKRVEGDEEELRSEVEEIVDETVDVNKSFPFTLTVTGESGSYSQKPTNIELEFDAETAFSLIAQALSVASGNPVAQGSALALTLATVSNKAKVTLSDEAGFVYWIAYKNHDAWEVPKSELVTQSIEEAEGVDANISLNEDRIEQAIRELDRKDCINIEGGEDNYVVLRELCKSKWK